MVTCSYTRFPSSTQVFHTADPAWCAATRRPAQQRFHVASAHRLDENRRHRVSPEDAHGGWHLDQTQNSPCPPRAHDASSAIAHPRPAPEFPVTVGVLKIIAEEVEKGSGPTRLFPHRNSRSWWQKMNRTADPSMSGRAPDPVALISGVMSATGSPHWLIPPKMGTLKPWNQAATARS